jgi:hypothetical protein
MRPKTKKTNLPRSGRFVFLVFNAFLKSALFNWAGEKLVLVRSASRKLVPKNAAIATAKL